MIGQWIKFKKGWLRQELQHEKNGNVIEQQFFIYSNLGRESSGISIHIHIHIHIVGPLHVAHFTKLIPHVSFYQFVHNIMHNNCPRANLLSVFMSLKLTVSK